jgi:hypothetical protein
VEYSHNFFLGVSDFILHFLPYQIYSIGGCNYAVIGHDCEVVFLGLALLLDGKYEDLVVLPPGTAWMWLT